MIEVKTAELIGPALDWAVAQAVCENVWLADKWLVNGKDVQKLKVCDFEYWLPSTDWSQGGPLIERFGCDLSCIAHDNCWEANCWDCDLPVPGLHIHEADTPLVAAMRAIVAAKLGDAVSVPAELVQQPTEGSGDE